MQDMQRLGGGSAEAGLVGQLAQFAELLPPGTERIDALQRLLGSMQECSSWRVRNALAKQLIALAPCLPMQVKPLLALIC